MARNNQENILSQESSQNILNTDEIISRSKVASSFKKSCAEIQNVQMIELQKISDIVIKDNENLTELNRKYEKLNLRTEDKLQKALTSNHTLITDMELVSDSFRKLDAAIKELVAHKSTAEKRNNEIDDLWKTFNVIKQVEIPEVEHRIQLVHEDIHKVQSSIRYNLMEKEVLESEQNKMSTDLTGLEEKLVKREKLLENLQQEFMLETKQNGKLSDKRDELTLQLQQTSANLIEVKEKFENFYGEKLAQIKIDLEKKLENEKLTKNNIKRWISDERVAAESELIKLNQQSDETQKNLRLEIEQYKNLRDELRESVELKKNQQIAEQTLLMNKTQRIEALEKRKSEQILLLQKKELENKELDVIHQTEELEIENAAKLEAQKLEDKNQRATAVNKEIRKKLVRRKLKVSVEVIPNSASKSTSSQLVSRNKSTDYSHSTQEDLEESFLSNISLGSYMTPTRFRLPRSFQTPYQRDMKIKSAGVSKQKPEDPFNS